MCTLPHVKAGYALSVASDRWRQYRVESLQAAASIRAGKAGQRQVLCCSLPSRRSSSSSAAGRVASATTNQEAAAHLTSGRCCSPSSSSTSRVSGFSLHKGLND